MPREINDNVGFLTEAKTALADWERMKKELSDLELEEKKLEKSLAAEKKAMVDNIQMTVAKAQAEISDSYDKELSKAQAALKKSIAKRQKAREKEVKIRISNETAHLKQENQALNAKIKTAFAKNNIPLICNSKIYYSLFFTRGIGEAFIFLASFLVAFLAIPYLAYSLIPDAKQWHMVLIYVVVILLFAGPYILLNDLTKVKNMAVMKEGRSARDQIIKNKKQMKTIESSILKDNSDEIYNLAEYDEEIDRMSANVKELNEKKSDALHNFEVNTKQAMINEIKQNSEPGIEKMSTALYNTQREIEVAAEVYKNFSLRFTEDYEAYIGKPFMQQDKLDSLIEILNSGEAAGIMEAKEVYQQKSIQNNNK